VQIFSQEENRTALFQLSINGQPKDFSNGKFQSFIVKEDGSVTIMAQTNLDILISEIIVLSIIPQGEGMTISAGTYPFFQGKTNAGFLTLAEYSAISNDEPVLWQTDPTLKADGGIVVEEITADQLLGSFTITLFKANEDGSIDAKNQMKTAQGRFNLPMETKSRLEGY
jgi:hypothetical protein